MAPRRECIEIPGIVHHGGMFPGAIPFGVRIGDMLFSSATYGQDPATSEYGEGLRAQAELAFQNTEALITKARCSLSDIGHVTVWLRELGDGEGADEFWNGAFPLLGDRPARSDYATDSMPSRIMIQTSIIAVVGAAREALIVDDVPGYDLAPVGVRMADVVFSSLIAGTNPAAGSLADGVEREAEAVLRNVTRVVEAAGGTKGNIARVSVRVRDAEHRSAVDKAWERMFPDPADRPARFDRVTHLTEGAGVAAEFIAVLGQTREPVELPNVSISGAPPAVRIGNLVFSSGIRGADSATGRLGEDSTRQAELAFENIQRVVELAGGTTDSIGHVMLWTRDRSCRDAANGTWLAAFPDDHNRPCRHAVSLDLDSGVHIEPQIIAVL